MARHSSSGGDHSEVGVALGEECLVVGLAEKLAALGQGIVDVDDQGPRLDALERLLDDRRETRGR